MVVYRRTFVSGCSSVVAVTGTAGCLFGMSGNASELHVGATELTQDEVRRDVLVDLEEVSQGKRTTIVRAIETGSHATTAYPLRTVSFVAYEGDYHRIGTDRSGGRTDRTETAEPADDGRNGGAESSNIADPRYTTKESDGQHETHRYSVTDTYSGFEAVGDAIVDSLVLPFQRGRVNDDAYGVVETAVEQGEYTASPMTDADEEAYRFLNEYDRDRADTYYPYYVRFEERYYRLEIRRNSGE